MVNSIGWGQGAGNNGIGWGQGAANNLISWGKSQILSWAGETDIAGGIYALSTNFQTRIATDLGTFEAQQCLINTLQTFKTL
jgi:hypothetical protein